MQDNYKVALAPEGSRYLSNNRSTSNSREPINLNRTIKTSLVDMFLKYQYTICVESTIPLSRLIYLSCLISIFNSKYYITLYWLSILYILCTIYLIEKFPTLFGSWYLNFFKRNSSTKSFEKYCDNFLGVIKAAIKNPEFFKIASKNSVDKTLVAAVVGLATEHTLHKAKVGQIYEYEMDKFINKGKHS